MKRKILFRTAFAILVALCPSLLSCQNSCADCSSVLANVYLRMNPIYEVYYGSFEDYVTEHASELKEGSPVLQCARNLSNALIRKAIEEFDPKDFERRQQLEEALRTIGGGQGGQHVQTQSEILMSMGRALARLVRVLPEAAKGDFEPYYTPTNELERQEAFAREMFKALLEDPMMEEVLRISEPQIKEIAELDYKIFVSIAENL